MKIKGQNLFVKLILCFFFYVWKDYIGIAPIQSCTYGIAPIRDNTQYHPRNWPHARFHPQNCTPTGFRPLNCTHMGFHLWSCTHTGFYFYSFWRVRWHPLPCKIKNNFFNYQFFNFWRGPCDLVYPPIFILIPFKF